MLKGVDLSNVNSRRAYPLGSRASWVEQQLHHGQAVHVENRVLGPAEYNPKRANEKHVGSPSLAQRSRLTAYGRQLDAFNPFDSALSIDRDGGAHMTQQLATSTNASPGSYTIVDDVLKLKRGERGFYERTEAATIFHDHDRRQGLDPHRRFCPTPDLGLSHDSLLLVHTTSGVQSPSKVVFGPDDIPFGERCPVKPAGPVYNPDYDSKQLKRTVKLSKISPTERKTYVDLQIQRNLRESEERRTDSAPSSSTQVLGSTISSTPGLGTHRANKPAPAPAASPIRMPILRTRKPPQLHFDASCYRAMAPEQVELNPRSISRLARVGIFNELLAQKREYDSSKMGSLIAEKVRRAAL